MKWTLIFAFKLSLSVRIHKKLRRMVPVKMTNGGEGGKMTYL